MALCSPPPGPMPSLCKCGTVGTGSSRKCQLSGPQGAHVSENGLVETSRAWSWESHVWALGHWAAYSLTAQPGLSPVRPRPEREGPTCLVTEVKFSSLF